MITLPFAHYAAKGLLSPPVTGFGHLLVEGYEPRADVVSAIEVTFLDKVDASVHVGRLAAVF
jgi:hypothetical protein